MASIALTHPMQQHKQYNITYNKPSQAMTQSKPMTVKLEENEYFHSAIKHEPRNGD